jgi:hydroxymethylglutaryl-CoA lyase
MADATDVVKFSKTIPGLVVTALVPNLKGAESAFEAGVQKVTIPFSASEAHSLANVRKSHDQMREEVAAIMALRNERFPNVVVETSLSTAFGCSISGPVSEDLVVALSEQLVALGVDEIGLADTTGYANPAQVRRLFTRVRAQVGARCMSAHMHNTRGLGLANVLAAYEVGIRVFDSSMGGIGGCPFAPGASGNVVTEDLVFMFEAMGISTGVSLDRLMLAREVFAQGLPDEPTYGMVPAAGLPRGFAPASEVA